MRSAFSSVWGSSYIVIVSAVLLPCVACTTTSGEPQDFWELEAEYWRYVGDRDAESYDGLFHEDFVGWQCAEPLPNGRANIGDWVRALRDEDATVTYELRKDVDSQLGDVAVVHYGVTWAFEYPDGRVVGKGVWQKITHTWMKTGDRWLIIGGMCGPLEESD